MKKQILPLDWFMILYLFKTIQSLFLVIESIESRRDVEDNVHMFENFEVKSQKIYLINPHNFKLKNYLERL